MRSPGRSARRIVALCIVGIAGAGCGAIGALNLAGSRERYRDVLRRSGEEQMLLNLVHLQYDDLPSFLQVATVVANLSAVISLGITPTVGAANQAALPLSGTLTESPAITYQPLQGDDFYNTLLRRIPESTIVELYRGGWNLREIIEIIVHDIGDFHNAPPRAPTALDAGELPPACSAVVTPAQRTAEEKALRFDAIIRELDRLAREHALDLDLEPPPPWASEPFGPSPSPKAAADEKKTEDQRPPSGPLYPVIRLNRPALARDAAWSDVERLLNTCLGAESTAAKLAAELPPTPSRCKETGFYDAFFFSNSHLVDQRFSKIGHVTVTLRSLLEVMSGLAGGVSTPEGCAHLRKTQACDDPDGAKYHGEHPLFRAYCSKHDPGRRAAVRVLYQDDWFYIDRRDMASRRAFAMLMLLFQQQLGKSITPYAPTLTLPIGR